MWLHLRVISFPHFVLTRVDFLIFKDELTLINWCTGEINIYIFVWILFVSSHSVCAFSHPLSTHDISF